MKLQTYFTLSIVASSVLMGAQYTDWNQTNFNNGDTIDINHNPPPPPQPPQPPQPPKKLVLDSDITIANGVVKATIKGNPTTQVACGIVACYNTQANINGTGTIIFDVRSTANLPAFMVKSGGLTTTASVEVQGNGLATIFQATGGNLTFNGGIKISGGNTAIKTSNSSTLTISGNKQVDISGNLDLGNTSTITLNQNNSRIQGNITQTKGDSTITLGSDSKIVGAITTSGGATTIQASKQAQIQGNLQITGKSDITLNDNSQIIGNTSTTGGTSTLKASGQAQIQGNFSASGAKTDVSFQGTATLNGTISTQNSNSTILFKGGSKVNGGISTTQGTANITFQDTATLNGTISTQNSISTILFKGGSKVTNGNISLTGGTNTLTATDQAQIQGSITTDGNTTITFDTDSKMTGNTSIAGGKTTLTATDQAQITGNITQTNGDSTIAFGNKSNITGDIRITAGSTGITFQDTAYIAGNLIAQGTTNKVTFKQGTELKGNLEYSGTSTIDFTESKITGNVIGGAGTANVTLTKTNVGGHYHQNDGTLNLTMSESNITKGFIGTNSTNTITTTKGSIKDGVKQSGGSLKLTSDETNFTGGFEGTNNSTNTITTTKGSIKGGVKQNSGSLTLSSSETDFTGGFEGTNNSTNTLTILQGDFHNGDIKQNTGSLKAEIIGLKNLNDFKGDNSNNNIQLVRTAINNVTQSGGGLVFKTDTKVSGNITGTNNSTNKITITGADVKGNISQNTGSMVFSITNGNTNTITATNASFGLYATDSTTKSITLTNAKTTGTSSNLEIKGEFKQTRGTSQLVFTKTLFQAINLIDTQRANFTLAQSKINGAVTAQNGTNSIALSDGEMQNFQGTSGNQTITLTKSTAQNFNQNGGTLSINASSASEIQSVSGTNSTLSITLNSSKVKQNISNSGNTTISAQNAEVGGDITQTNGSMNLNAENSTFQGSYTQTGGNLTGNLTKSSIKQGATLTSLASGSLNLNQDSSIEGGLKAENSVFDFTLNHSSITKGTAANAFSQTRGRVTGTLNAQSHITGNITLEHANTSLSLYQDSKITGDITATDNTTKIFLDRSKIEGNITIAGGSLNLTAQNHSQIKSTQMQLTNADLKLTLDTSSEFIGDLTQTNNKQEIIIRQDSKFQGNITNTNTTGTISINHATLQGNLTQNGGTLGLDLSNEGKITGKVDLTGATTTLSGLGTGNQIGGNFTQTNGTLTGAINGLTLKGIYTQTGGTSEVSFTNSAFQNETKITNANSSSLTFNQSTLKDYTISGGQNNTLKLLNNTTMTGNLTLTDKAKGFLQMLDSKITGNIKGTNDSTLDFDTKASHITGNIEFNTGGITGTNSNTQIGGKVELIDTTSDIAFVAGSSIGQDLIAKGVKSNNIIKLNASQIKGKVEVENGKFQFDLSNGSKVGGAFTLKSTTAHLTGSPANNSIVGNFLSKETTLTGNISGVTLQGTFTQEQGTSTILFDDRSHFKGATTINEATSANLTFRNNSGITNKVTITKGDDNTINLINHSFIKGNITLNQTKATLSAELDSLIKGDTTATKSTTTFKLNRSELKGNITQNQGRLDITATNQSNLASTITATNAPTNLTLENSNFTGAISQTKESLTLTLTKGSTLAANTNNKITLKNANLQANIQASTLDADITHTADTQNITANLSFTNQSTYSGKMNFTKINSNIEVNDSTFNSDLVHITQGEFDLKLTNAKGYIKDLSATNTKLKITSQDSSLNEITALTSTGSTFDLIVKDNAKLTGSVTLNNSKATYTATAHGNINLDTLIKDQTSTLEVKIKGGILQGSIKQIATKIIGSVTLENEQDPNGKWMGGRWAVTDDSEIEELTISNAQDIIQSQAIFTPALKGALSMVDFTLEKNDALGSSRVGKEMIPTPPPPQAGQPIPPPGQNQTYARTLKLNNIKGDNGLFRVYADLGTSLADKVLTQKASGSHLVQVIYRPDTFGDIGAKRIVVAKVTDPATSVSFKGTQSDVGLTRYDTQIIKENAQGGGFEWIIGQATKSGISYTSKIIASILQTQYRNFSIEYDNLDARLGDLRHIKRDKGIWVRGYFGKATKAATDYSIGTNDQYYSIWAGTDYNSKGLTVHNFLGIFANYTNNATENKEYTGTSSSYALGFYDTFRANSGFYFDFLAKYIFTQSAFEISNYSLENNKPAFNNHKFLVSGEIGYDFFLDHDKNAMYLQPQFQITSGWVGETRLDFVDVSNVTIHSSVGGNAPAIIRAGLFFGKRFGEEIITNLKIGSSLVYDVNSGGRLEFEDNSTQLDFLQGGDFRMTFNAHADVSFTDAWKIYADFNTSFFGSYNTTYNANFGLRFTFGRKNNLLSKIPMVYNPYEPTPPPEYTRRNLPTIRQYTTHDINENYKGKSREVVPLSPKVAAPSPITQQEIQRTYRTTPRDQAIEIYGDDQ
ncbi:hypothetical protein BBW65_02165 [Helicobacter enhydrae]|uniref:Autotransporter domain-containing protein n=1 Tax=Helicobacter enhydrae TaxID=222136 RepID=A0A1B1U4P8_9HELI|nr:hypothetical protein [Helicobacter enhydrae]ANV97682.1 hypothetical protein BBW65_02165 [Helicobacter enhydrae]